MDEQQMATLYRAYGPVIFGCCRALLSDDAAAMDAMQDTFIRVFGSLDRVPNDKEAMAWIYRIATNVCLNRLRDAQRLAQRHARGATPEATPSDPSGQLVDRDLVQRLLSELPEKIATAAWLYYVDGLDQPEMAEVLGVSRGTIVTRLATFRRLAREFLDGQDDV